MSVIVDRTGYFGETSELCSRIYLMGQKLWKYGPRTVHGQVEKFSGVEMDGLDWIGERRRTTAARGFFV